MRLCFGWKEYEVLLIIRGTFLCAFADGFIEMAERIFHVPVW